MAISLAQPILNLFARDPEGAINETYSLSGDQSLINDNVPFGNKVRIAKTYLLEIRKNELGREEFGAELVTSGKSQLTEGETATNILAIVNNPEKLEIGDNEINKVLDAAYYIYGTPDDLSPTKPFEERKVTAEKYLINTMDQPRSISVTTGDLREIEEHISKLARLDPKDLASKSEILEKISSKLDIVKKGFDVNPEKFLTKEGLKKLAINKAAKQVATKVIGAKAVQAIASVAATPVVGAIVGFLAGKLMDLASWLKAKFTRNKEAVIGTIGGLMVLGGMLIPGVLGAVLVGTGAVSMLGVGAAAATTFIGALFAGFMALVVFILWPLIVGSALLMLFTVFTIYVITTGAYVVPQGMGSVTSGTGFGGPPIGSIIDNCPEDGDITAQLASQIPSGIVNLLPDTLSPRSIYRACIKPTMMIMHWSAGTNDNPNGNEATYNTVVNRDLACQLMTDTNDVWLTQPYYEEMVEMSWCAQSWNSYSINNEMAGVAFTGTPPPPNLAELQLAYQATCVLMTHYKIPWCQIYGHYEVPNNGGKTDPGVEFLHNVFIPEIRNRCPNDPGNICN